MRKLELQVKASNIYSCFIQSFFHLGEAKSVIINKTPAVRLSKSLGRKKKEGKKETTNYILTFNCNWNYVYSVRSLPLFSPLFVCLFPFGLT